MRMRHLGKILKDGQDFHQQGEVCLSMCACVCMHVCMCVWHISRRSGALSRFNLTQGFIQEEAMVRVLPGILQS